MPSDINIENENIKLDLNTEITDLLESRGILEKEVKMVIHTAEDKGEKLYEPEGDHFLAKKRIGDVTYFVEYRPTAEDTFEVITAYCCKSTIEEE